MKNLFVLFILMFSACLMYGQRTETATTADGDTAIVTLTQPTQISILATEVAGTTDGTVTLQGSVDGVTYTNIQPAAGAIYYFPSDTSELTGHTWSFTDGASLLAVFEKPYFNHVRMHCIGTASDTTLMTVKWVK
jgi:hypothetical protein